MLGLNDTYLIQFIQIAIKEVSWLPRDSGLFVLSDQTSCEFLTSLKKKMRNTFFSPRFIDQKGMEGYRGDNGSAYSSMFWILSFRL